MSLLLSQIRYCCGAQILESFDGHTPEQIREELQSHKKSRYNSQSAVTFVLLNDGMHLRFHDVLESEGFKLVVAGAHNAKHNSKIYTYVHVFRPEKSDPVLYPAAEVDY